MKAYIVEKELLSENIEKLLKQAGDTPIWAVLKGGGYGLGTVPMARALAAHGIERFCVTELREASALREAGFTDAPILMLRQTQDPEEINAMLDLRLIFTVGSLESALVLNAIAAERAAMAEVHLKIDTGMGRYGFLPEQVDQAIRVYEYQKNLMVGGVYTHFHSAFCSERATRDQFERFQQVVRQLQAAGYETGVVHCCNSSAFLRWPEMYLDGVRLGSALLGRVGVPNRLGLNRIGYVEADVEELRWLPAGSTVGYAAAWRAKKPTLAAIIGVGWYHGFATENGCDLFRVRDCLRGILQNLKRIFFRKTLSVQIGERSYPVIGRVGMVHTTVDVSDGDVKVGDKAIIQINPLVQKGMKILYR